MSVDSNGGSDLPADFHLVEAQGAWCLTVRAGERLMAALAGETQLDDAGAFTVQVEPNLLPSGIFDARVDIAPVLDIADETSRTPQKRKMSSTDKPPNSLLKTAKH